MIILDIVAGVVVINGVFLAGLMRAAGRQRPRPPRRSGAAVQRSFSCPEQAPALMQSEPSHSR